MRSSRTEDGRRIAGGTMALSTPEVWRAPSPRGARRARGTGREAQDRLGRRAGDARKAQAMIPKRCENASLVCMLRLPSTVRTPNYGEGRGAGGVRGGLAQATNLSQLCRRHPGCAVREMSGGQTHRPHTPRQLGVPTSGRDPVEVGPNRRSCTPSDQHFYRGRGGT